MPIIMTSHIANSSSVQVQSHSLAIIHEAGPSIVPYMSSAIGTIHDQHSNTTITSAPTVSQRSCFKADSSAVSFAHGARISSGARPRAWSSECAPGARGCLSD